MSSDSRSAELIKLLQWFNSIPTERQAYLISQWFKDMSVLPEEEKDRFTGIAYYIRQALITSDKNELVSILIQLGVDDVLARVLVEKVEETSPTPHMDAEVLNSLSNEVFEQIVKSVLCLFYGNYQYFSEESEADRIGIDKQYLGSTIRIIRDHLIWDFLGGQLNRNSAIIRFQDEFMLDKEKVSIMIKLLEENENRLREQMQLARTIDIDRQIDTLKKSHEEIISTLEELLRFLKKVFEGKEPYSRNIA